MDTFLQEKIDLIYERHGDALENFAIIIPNKRAAVYIQKYLSNHFDRPFFAPLLLTINEWVDMHTPLKIISQTELLFVLYDVHKSIEKKEAESFNDFIKWGKIMLSDFDEVDRYLIPPKLIFRDLRNIKEIENWSFLEETLSKGQEDYLTLWDKLPNYYKAFNDLLKKMDATYQGAAYKRFYEKLTREEINQQELKEHYYFIGFNALSASEDEIIRFLVKNRKATAFFDVDESYFNNPEHEAGHFYRKIIRKWQIKKETGKWFNEIPKEITVIETAQQIAQAKIAGSIVNDLLLAGENMDHTAIVLADESLLIPLTRSLPHDLERANITMGYPIKFSHLKSLIDLVFDLQSNFQKFKSAGIYHKSLLHFLDHPYVREIIRNNPKIQEFEKELTEKNKIFITQHELIERFHHLDALKMVFVRWEKPIEDGFTAFNYLIKALYVALKSADLNRQIDLEIVYHFAKGFKKFEVIAERYPHQLNLRSFKMLFYQFWQGERLSFLGNPIEGLQIMGILETRTLDFENLIVLGMNEGNLPKTNVVNTFIPRDLKLNHQLPVEEDRQAIFAHHFYRLLHRAKKVYFTYNATSEGVGTSERSRFITQLENELDPAFGHQIKHYTYASEDKAAQIADVKYHSNEAIQKKLDERLATGLSPSALNKFVRCPLDFYYRYILGMKENTGVEENIESSTFGTKIHNVLERIFKDNFLSKKEKLSIEVLEKERKNVSRYLKEAYLEDFSEMDIAFGQNKLSFEVSLGFIDRFLKQQIKELQKTDAPVYIIDLEKTIKATYKWDINGEMKTVTIEGNADRIEQFGSHYRIIDYKSGKCDATKVSLDAKILEEGEMEKFMFKDDKGYGRQLLMYALMFRATYPEYKNFSAGIISMVNIDQWVQNVKVKKSTTEILTDEVLDAFEQELKDTITALYDEAFVFEHDPKSRYCEHCEV